MIPSETWHCSSGRLGGWCGSLIQPQWGTVGTGSCAHVYPQTRGWMLGECDLDPHCRSPVVAALHIPYRQFLSCTHYQSHYQADCSLWTDPSLCGDHYGGLLAPEGHYSAPQDLDREKAGHCHLHQAPKQMEHLHLRHLPAHGLSCGFLPVGFG